MTKPLLLPILSLALAACAVETEVEELAVTDDIAGAELAIPAELELAEAAGVDGTPYASQSYCVDQSYASANNVTCEVVPICNSQPNYDTQLSRNHRVRMVIPSTCTGTYVHVASLWNHGSCYHMRRDALRPC
jgi:hypothetical protein